MLPFIAFCMFASLAFVIADDESNGDMAKPSGPEDTDTQNNSPQEREPLDDDPQDQDPDGLKEFDPADFEDILPETPVERYVSGAAGGFNIEVEFEGNWNVEQQQGVVTAAEFLSAAIVEDVPDFQGKGGIDDLRITAHMENIDGSGGSLAYASVGALRADSHLPAEAVMVFDRADVNYLQGVNAWVSTIVHEMLHGLGFGVVWDRMGLVEGSVSQGDPRFTGENATDAYNNDAKQSANDPGSARGVPIEADGPAGQAGGHWDEVTFGNELMTPLLGGRETLSDITWGALEDMGYDTLYDDRTDPNDARGTLPTLPA